MAGSLTGGDGDAACLRGVGCMRWVCENGHHRKPEFDQQADYGCTGCNEQVVAWRA